MISIEHHHKHYKESDKKMFEIKDKQYLDEKWREIIIFSWNSDEHELYVFKKPSNQTIIKPSKRLKLNQVNKIDDIFLKTNNDK